MELSFIFILILYPASMLIYLTSSNHLFTYFLRFSTVKIIVPSLIKVHFFIPDPHIFSCLNGHGNLSIVSDFRESISNTLPLSTVFAAGVQ